MTDWHLKHSEEEPCFVLAFRIKLVNIGFKALKTNHCSIALNCLALLNHGFVSKSSVDRLSLSNFLNCLDCLCSDEEASFVILMGKDRHPFCLLKKMMNFKMLLVKKLLVDLLNLTGLDSNLNCCLFG
jgi:hypothetical protein